MNKTTLFAVWTACSTLASLSYVTYNYYVQTNQIQTVAPFNAQLVEYVARTGRKHLATKDVAHVYNRVHQLCTNITNSQYKQELISTVMLSNDIYNKRKRRSLFSSSYKHLPFVQYVNVLDRMITLMYNRREYEFSKRLEYIRTVVIQQKEYRKEKMVLAGNKKSSPFELLKFTFGIFKLF